MSNVDRVQAWRKRAKIKLVEIAGNACRLCGYNKCITALEFHHIDPAEKDFAVTGSRDTRRFSLMVEEIRKCILVCANCHREIHYGLVEDSDLKARQHIDETLVVKYTTDVEAIKAAVKFQKGENSRKRREAKQLWAELHPYTNPAIKKVNWTEHDVFSLLAEHKTYEAVGRLLGVTGAAIKRRLKHLESKMENHSEIAQR